jgi:hypothetical protein
MHRLLRGPFHVRKLGDYFSEILDTLLSLF